jgi:aspartate aminotransferase-like enzyme
VSVFIKQRLLTPGPTPVPERIRLAMAAEMSYHRSPQIKEVIRESQELLRWLYQTKELPLILTGSGTAAMEASVVSFLSPGDQALVIRGGKFGERFFKICQAVGVEAIALDIQWGESATPDQVAEKLKAHPKIKAVLWQATETSTGALHPTQEIAARVRQESKALCIVDAITALGVFELKMDAWGLDVVICGSQKALMLPPGLAFVAASERAWRRGEDAQCHRFYLSLQKERQMQEKAQTAFTPAVSLVLGLREALAMLREEGLSSLFSRHHKLAKAARMGGVAMGLSLFAKTPSNATTALSLPEKLDGELLSKRLKEHYGVTLGGGQDQLKGKIIRIGHVGYFDAFDIITALAALEMALSDLGAEISLGAAVSAAQQVFRG